MMLALRKMPVSPCRSETINDRSRGLRCSSVHDEMNKSTTAARPSAEEALVMAWILEQVGRLHTEASWALAFPRAPGACREK